MTQPPWHFHHCRAQRGTIDHPYCAGLGLGGFEPHKTTTIEATGLAVVEILKNTLSIQQLATETIKIAGNAPSISLIA